MKATIYTDLGRFETPYNANRYSKSVFITTIRKEGTWARVPETLFGSQAVQAEGEVWIAPETIKVVAFS